MKRPRFVVHESPSVYGTTVMVVDRWLCHQVVSSDCSTRSISKRRELAQSRADALNRELG